MPAVWTGLMYRFGEAGCVCRLFGFAFFSSFLFSALLCEVFLFWFFEAVLVLRFGAQQVW